MAHRRAPKADSDLDDIWLWVVKNSANIDIADRLIDSIADRFFLLSTVRLVKDYEDEHHPLPDPNPHEMLVYLMEQRGLKQADLLPIFKSRGYVSDVINAKRAISKAHAKQLAVLFKVSPSLFI